MCLPALLGCDETSSSARAQPPSQQERPGDPGTEADNSERGDEPSAAPPLPAANADLYRAQVVLVPIGRFPEGQLDAIEAGLREELDVDVTRAPGLALPRSAYYAPRRRYRAEKLLDFLKAEHAGSDNNIKLLGLTSVDISTTKGHRRDWGILGLGDIGGRSCVLSTFRMRRGDVSAERVRFRLVSTAVHEVGHTLGLPHCTERRCVMNDARGTVRTIDRSTGRVHARCEALLDTRAPRSLRFDPPDESRRTERSTR